MCQQGRQGIDYPKDFFEVLSEFYAIFADNEQHDTSELAENVVDGLMEDTNHAKDPKPYIEAVSIRCLASDLTLDPRCRTILIRQMENWQTTTGTITGLPSLVMSCQC